MENNNITLIKREIRLHASEKKSEAKVVCLKAYYLMRFLEAQASKIRRQLKKEIHQSEERDSKENERDDQGRQEV